ncbi:hypothetical protein F4820DRAFT_10404 [Hypoxylon rubiginosum]|uniref:Uncharacterized protein n=1 Tax=Hypoxylon rubiginosum TaxID=110542 RepID=A0ACB9ZF54_9PEZI|nr:hypothetical protein F4820DRAFT_10404 [Hypoxylon rubiginosum]
MVSILANLRRMAWCSICNTLLVRLSVVHPHVQGASSISISDHRKDWGLFVFSLLREGAKKGKQSIFPSLPLVGI